jgi:uncharacterized protein (TIGR03067 family)
MNNLGAIALAIGLFMSAEDPKEPANKKDLDALQGSWSLSSVVLNGEEIPQDLLKTAKLVIDGQKYTVTLGEQTTVSTFKIDAGKNPKQIEFTYTAGPQTGQTVQGIYEVDAETYKLCRAVTPETERPTKFEAPADSGLIYAVGKRPKAVASIDPLEAKELEKVTGVWMHVGENITPEMAKARLIYKGREFEGRMGDRVLFKGYVKLDPTKTPKAIDMTLTQSSGPAQGKTLLGVYELDDENYRGCLAGPDKTRPTSLTPAPESGQRPFAFKRVKNEEPAKVDSARPEAIKAELKRFEGTWSYASIITDGKPLTEQELDGKRLILSGDRFTVTSSGDPVRGIYAVDPTKSPKTLDVTFGDGPNAGKTLKGIYELDRDNCKVCINMGDQPRPTEFVSKPGDGHALEALKRQTP